MNRFISIVLACFVGGFIGALVSLEFNSLPFVGWVVGAALGYFLVDIRHLVAGISKAWQASLSKGVDWRGIRHVFLYMTILWGVGLQLVLGLIILAALSRGTDKIWPTLLNVLVDPYPLLFSSLMLPLFVFRISVQIASINDGGVDRLINWLKTNPLRLSFVYGLWVFARWVVIKLIPIHIPTFVRFLVRFGRHAFVFVHSDRRLICMVSSGFGSLVGYSLGSAIVGGLAGIAVGLVMYQVISVRWLKIQPAVSTT